MKGTRLLVWLTQLAISVFMPLGGFVLLGVWLRTRFSLGVWVLLLCCALGVIGAARGLTDSLKIMEKITSEGEKKPDTVSFNRHE